MKNVDSWWVMRINYKHGIIFIIFLIGFVLYGRWFKPTPVPVYDRQVVVTFSILEDFAKKLLKGVPKIEIHTLINCDQDPHSFHPHPKICVLLNKAHVVVVNGLDFEHWFKPCNEHIKGLLVIASDGVVPLRLVYNPTLFDPHAWHDVNNALIYINNMQAAFKKVFPESVSVIERNYQKFRKELEALEVWIREQFVDLKDRTIITTHDAFWYYGKAYAVQFISPQGISTEEEISAAKMAQIVHIIKSRKVKALFLESLSNSAAIKQLAQETNTKIGGVLYADTISESSGPCPSYVSMIQHNTKTICQALS